MSQNETMVDVYDELADELIGNLTKSQLAELLREKAAYESQAVLPEAGGSISGYIQTPGGWECLVTVRGPSIEIAWEQVSSFMKRRMAQGCTPGKGSGQRGVVINQAVSQPADQTNPVKPTQQAPVSNQPDPKTGLYEFRCATLDVSMNGGKTYYKVKSAPGSTFASYGVTCWPEVFAAAGITEASLKHGMDLSAYIATYLMGPSKKDPTKLTAQKITNLRKA